MFSKCDYNTGKRMENVVYCHCHLPKFIQRFSSECAVLQF